MGGGTASSSCPTSPNPPQANVRHVPRCGCTAVAQALLTCRPNVNLQLEAGSVHHVWGRRSCRGAQSREKWLRESRTAAWNPLHCAAEGGAQSRDPPWHGLNAQLQQPHRGHTAGGDAEDGAGGSVGTGGGPGGSVHRGAELSGSAWQGEEKAELTGRDNGSECNNCLGESPRSIRETDFYMHVFKGISFAFLFPSPFFCFGIKGQKGALLTIKFNLNRKEGRTGTWLTRELAAGGVEHPPVPPSSVPPPPPSMGRSWGQHTALLPFPSSSLPLCCDLSI